MSQIYTFILPDIGEGISEVEIVSWSKAVGEKIEENESIVTVLSDKASVELPSPYSGKLLKSYHQEGQIALVGQPIFDLELIDQPKTEALALPSTRQLAKKLNIDINAVVGTGKDGRISDDDVQNYHMSIKTLKDGDKDLSIPLPGIKRQMLKKMEQSRSIPHFSYFEQVDATWLIGLRNELKNKGYQSLTYMPFIVKALSLTIEKYPILNSSIVQGDRILYHKEHNFCIAASSKKGLLVPVFTNVQGLTLKEIIDKYNTFINLIRSNELKEKDMKNGTITISNFGVLGNGLWTTPIISPPQVAVLALAKIQKLPFIKNERLEAVDVLNLSWSFDHRVIDGEEATGISNFFAKFIENPDSLL